METPRPKHFDDFRVFAAMLGSLSEADPIVIPGNHDERMTWEHSNAL
jgi:metallophosphoesterase superfamily enzyme